MEPKSPEKESQIDATQENETASSLESEGQKDAQPSASSDEATTLSDENPTVVSPEDDRKDTAVDKNSKAERKGQEDGKEAGIGNRAGADQPATASAEDVTLESTTGAVEEKANENTTGNPEDKETKISDNQEGDKQSPSTTAKRKLDTDDSDAQNGTETAKEASKNGDTGGGSASLPKRPIKRARTAYFIFTDEKRPEVQAAHPGEGVAAVAKAMGQMWGNLSAEEKKVYQDQAAKERERVSQELEAYKSAGGKDLDSPSAKARDPLATILPVARIRKICKLDPEVRGLSKEALLLVTKCTELVLAKLGKETVKVANLQNRRKLIPDDVAHVCAHREQFLFLKDDVKDLVRSMESFDGKANGGKKGDAAKQAAAAGTKKLTSYFGAAK